MKYLVSLYFDDKTNQQILKYMAAVAEATGNDYMLAHAVPPHITISSFETENVEAVLPKLQKCMDIIEKDEIQWVGTGAFMMSTLYLTPVLNQYLQTLAETVYLVVSATEDVRVSKYYQPFQWIPHTTVGKKLKEEQLIRAFEVVQPKFKVIKGRVVKIGLAKASPYEDIVTWNCKE